MESHDSEFSQAAWKASRVDSLMRKLYEEAISEIRDSVYSFGGKNVTGDGIDINITFSTLRQAFMWADAFGMIQEMELIPQLFGPVSSFNDKVRVYVVGVDYAVKQLNRLQYRSYAFGEKA